jgi:hypothetical protein
MLIVQFREHLLMYLFNKFLLGYYMQDLLQSHRENKDNPRSIFFYKKLAAWVKRQKK